MIIEFSLGNYRSFKDLQTLSFRATGLVSEDRQVDKDNIAEIEGQRLLKTIGLYGPNGSGKSNLLRGLAFMQYFVTNSLESETILKRYRDFFKLSSDFPEFPPSFFQMILLIEGKRYRYGFTINNQECIDSEWLFGPAERNETYYFKRSGSEIDINKERYLEGDGIPLDKVRKDALFLSFVSSYDGAVSRSIRSFIADKIVIDSQNKLIADFSVISKEANLLTNQLVESGKKELVIEWMKQAGIFINDVELEKIEYKKTETFELIYFVKNSYNDNGEVVGSMHFWLDSHESAGTRKYFDYIGEMVRLFETGGVFISDEIDNNFHPSLLRKIVKQFNNPDLNQKGAQLLFSSHDTNLMDPDIMRRDQFYFTEKTTTDHTKLYSLADLKGIRNNADFARQYLSGAYGALPLLKDFLPTELPISSTENTK